ncbi:syntenin-1-like isoform X1 [Octodon degus]|uniref:Syntenin-1-like isoform X1 n=1 Tax=Octodon degus TaxID=10160 RepID=A0A6P6EI15_OCTDE|nr:syntenin-1-like isoform X1 [Octodon degus]
MRQQRRRATCTEKNPAEMSLYPSLEDLKVGKVIQAQIAFSANPANPAVLLEASAPISQDGNLYPKLYPELSQYMGLNLNEEEMCAMVPGAPVQGQLVGKPSSMNYMVAPVTGSDVGIRRAEIKQGIREVILCKDQDGKIGLRIKSVDNGVSAQLVQTNSPASSFSLRFGDQVLQINGENCVGCSSDKAHKVFKQAFGEKITMTIHDRPFEGTITMHKDSSGHVGFIFKNGKITSIVKDSSAARNGLLTEHNICKINGQNVIGLKDSQTTDILSMSGTIVTITSMPAFIFEHIIKRMAPSIMKSLMDHTIPEV